MKETQQLIGVQDLGQARALVFGKRNALDFPGFPQRHRVQKPQRCQNLAISDVCNLVHLDQMQQKLANLSLAHLLGTAAIKGGKATAVQEVIPARRWAESFQDQVLFHPIVKASHVEPPGCKIKNRTQKASIL